MSKISRNSIMSIICEGGALSSDGTEANRVADAIITAITLAAVEQGEPVGHARIEGGELILCGEGCPDGFAIYAGQPAPQVAPDVDFVPSFERLPRYTNTDDGRMIRRDDYGQWVWRDSVLEAVYRQADAIQRATSTKPADSAGGEFGHDDFSWPADVVDSDAEKASKP